MNSLIPNTLERPIQEIKDGYLQILGENLAGIYIHGSIAMNCYNPNSSDIDFLVIVKENIRTEEKKQIIQLLLELSDKYPIKKGFEMSIVLKRYATNFIYHTPFLLHYSNDWKESYQKGKVDYEKTEDEDPDLAAHFTVTKARGICIYGKPIDEVFGEVPKKDYIDSLMYDLEEVENNIIQDPVYNGLNLCRVLQYLEEEQVASKLEGGEWGLKNLPEIYKKFVKELLDVYEGNKIKYNLEQENLKEFARYMIEKINAKLKGMSEMNSHS